MGSHISCSSDKMKIFISVFLLQSLMWSVHGDPDPVDIKIIQQSGVDIYPPANLPEILAESPEAAPTPEVSTPTTPTTTTPAPTTPAPACNITGGMINTPGMITIKEVQFKTFTDRYYTWAEAKQLCTDKGLYMAELYGPRPEINDFVEYLENIFHGSFWLGASGDGSAFAWNSGKVNELEQSDGSWYSDHPTGKLDHCLRSTFPLSSQQRRPMDRPYF